MGYSPLELHNRKQKRMRKLLLIFASLVAFTFLQGAYAADSEMVSGEVKKVDESTDKITLKHGPIKSLGMDEGMTMVWSVQDRNALKGLKAGDKVRFQAENIDGQLTVTKIERAK
jgi:Cu(I)/Ag(I) efflux system protein CusF